MRNLGVIALLAWTIVLWKRPLIFAAIVAFILIGHIVNTEDATSQTVRSFFGVHKISESDGRQLPHPDAWHDHPRRRAHHARTRTTTTRRMTPNGRRSRAETQEDRPTPLTYYFDGSPLAQTIDAARQKAGGPARIAVIGLGSGSLACQTRPGDKLTYYEIDPMVVRIARDPERFTFLTDCAPDATIVLGDARLTLVDAPDAAYDLIIVDAFSSDAIPIHLMTREAMELYARKIAPNGMVVMHLSNRHLELASVVAGIAQANGLVIAPQRRRDGRHRR